MLETKFKSLVILTHLGVLQVAFETARVLTEFTRIAGNKF